MKKHLLSTLLLLSIFYGCNDNRYTIFFDTNGGSIVGRLTVKEGSRANKPEDPKKENFGFAGWYRDSSLHIEFNFETEIINSDIILYAKWGKAYKVTFNLNGGSGTPPPPQIVTEGQNVEEPKNTPTKNGSIFLGWSLNKEGGELGLFLLNVRSISENITLYAIWGDDNPRNRLLAAMNKIKNQNFIYAKGEQVDSRLGHIVEDVWINYKNKSYLSKTYIGNSLGRCTYLANSEKYFFELLPAKKTFQKEAFEILVYNEFDGVYIKRMKEYLDIGTWNLSDNMYKRIDTTGTEITQYWAKLNNNNFLEEVGFLKIDNEVRKDSAKITFKYTNEPISFPNEIEGGKDAFKDIIPTKKVTIHWSDGYDKSIIFKEKVGEGYYFNTGEVSISNMREIFSGEKCNNSNNNCWKSYKDAKHSDPFLPTSGGGGLEIEDTELIIYAEKLQN